MTDAVLCSDCFHDQGLKLDATRIGVKDTMPCPNCSSISGAKLSREATQALAYCFFVRGTIQRVDYGGAPVVQMNEHQRDGIDAPPWLEPDVRLIQETAGIGFFHYGPRDWMLGHIEPLQALQAAATRAPVIERIIRDYADVDFTADQLFYRLRRNPKRPADVTEFDSQPMSRAGSGRLDSSGFPVMYGSQDLQVCIHECRAAAEDDLFLATLAPARTLKLLDLTQVLKEAGVTEFESLDIAVQMLFLAREHSYEISRDIALAAHAAGYDGLMYPSYFSLLRTGAVPFQTSYGFSHRLYPEFSSNGMPKMVPNLALFGRPIAIGAVTVRSVNKLILNRVDYDISFGPAYF